MHHIAPPLHEPLIREILLSRMALAPENVRKTPADPVAEAEMKASIATHGLLDGSVAKFGAEVVNLLRRLERGIGGWAISRAATLEARSCFGPYAGTADTRSATAILKR